MNKLIPFALFTATSLLVAPSFAAEGAREAAVETEFGDPGTINVGADTLLDFSYESSKPPIGDSTTITRFGIGVDGAYFVAPDISVGARIGLDHVATKLPGEPEADTDGRFTIMAVGGYNAWITPGSLSVWPQLGIGWVRDAFTSTLDTGASITRVDTVISNLRLELFVPVLIHPVKHFHLGIGPFLDLDLTGSASQTSSGTTQSGDGPKSTIIGLRGEIAGWL